MKRDSVSDKFIYVDPFGFDVVNNKVKVCVRCIATTHQRSFAFVELRVRETNLIFLQSDKNIASTMRYPPESVVDCLLVSGCVYDKRGHIPVCVRCELFMNICMKWVNRRLYL